MMRVEVYLHGEQAGQVDLGDGLGPLPASLPHAASPVFVHLGLLAGFHQMPQTHAAFLPVVQHGGLWWRGGYSVWRQSSF